jgi:S1-C subfamily serine protease
MRHVICILVLSAVCCVPHRTVRPVLPDTTVASVAYHSHVNIWITQGGDDRGHGSGVILYTEGDRVFIATAKHVADVEETEQMEVEFPGLDTRYPARQEYLHPTVDIAVVSIRAPSFNLPTAVIATVRPIRGDTVVIVGSPGPTEAFISFSHIAGICGETIACRACPDGRGCYITDQPIFPGNSGGGVFNIRGEVIGIVVALGLMRVGSSITDPYCGIFVGIEHLPGRYISTAS